jgi:hypothetical protein
VNINKLAVTLFLAAGMTACTSPHKTAHIKCFSGDLVIYEGYTADNINTSAGFRFVGEDGLVREFSGDCIITYDRPRVTLVEQP